MSFMQKEITDKTGWIEVETLNGTFFVETEYVPQIVLDFIEACDNGLYEPDEIPATVRCNLLEYVPECWDANQIQEIKYIEGYGARMSAPGYLDCTDWSVFDTEQEAYNFLNEFYGDEG